MLYNQPLAHRFGTALANDIENTSAEGLRDLLDWESNGSLETHIYHNEANPTFHPKIYLLRNDAEARLIVGSNNITGAGLFVNTERTSARCSDR